MIDAAAGIEILAALDGASGAALRVEGVDPESGEPMPGIVIAAVGEEAIALAAAFAEIHGEGDTETVEAEDMAAGEVAA